MTALRLAISAKRLGARFEYRDGQIVVLGIEQLPPSIRRPLLANIHDVLAVVAEHSPPPDVCVTDVLDSARRIASHPRPPSTLV